jgi:hypothetical protein
VPLTPERITAASRRTLPTYPAFARFAWASMVSLETRGV